MAAGSRKGYNMLSYTENKLVEQEIDLTLKGNDKFRDLDAAAQSYTKLVGFKVTSSNVRYLLKQKGLTPSAICQSKTGTRGLYTMNTRITDTQQMVNRYGEEMQAFRAAMNDMTLRVSDLEKQMKMVQVELDAFRKLTMVKKLNTQPEITASR